MAKRLINTSEERGINEDEINNSSDDYGMEEEVESGVEEKSIETPEELIQSTKQLKLEEMDEKQIEEKYLDIVGKIEVKKELTKQEQVFKQKVDEAIAKADEVRFLEQTKKELEEKEKSLEEKEAFLKEYSKVKEADPSKIIKAEEQEISLRGGESIPKLISFIIKMKKAKKKGGKILVQVFRNKRVVIKWTLNDVSYVEFYSKDEKGNELVEVTRFNEFIYTYEGTPIPVLFAIQGVAEGFNFFENFQTSITSEMISRLTSRAYHAGYEKGAELVSPNKKGGMFAGLEPFMPIIILGGFILMIFMMYLLYGEVTNMIKEVEAVKQAVGVMVLQ